MKTLMRVHIHRLIRREFKKGREHPKLYSKLDIRAVKLFGTKLLYFLNLTDGVWSGHLFPV